MILRCCFLLFVVFAACEPDDSLRRQLDGADGVVKLVLKEPDRFRVQILQTELDATGQPVKPTQSFRHRPDEYFYPASTVKLPVAVLALERCRDLGIDPWAPMLTDSAAPFQHPVWTDTSAENGLPSVAHYIRKIFLVSDNEAFNRLYEFLGPAWLHQRMTELGYPDVRLVHRLAVPLSRRDNQLLNPIRFLLPSGDTLNLPARMDSLPPPLSPPVLVGKGDMVQGVLVNGPKDFSEKNAFPLLDQHHFLREVLFPDSASGLRLLPQDYLFLREAMSQLPGESGFPRYDPAHYPDGYAKFFLIGDGFEPMPSHLKVYNKIGLAYGWVIDNALIVNEKTGEQQLLSAVVYVNEDGVFNDDHYEYDEIGLPFLASLGKWLLGE